MQKYTTAVAAILFISIATSCSSESPPSSKAPDVTSNEAGTKGPPAGPTGREESSDRLEQDYLCNPDQCRSVGPLQARSVQEARWLIENGYPNEEESERLRSLGTAQLKAEGESGNIAAQVFYGKRVALESNFLSGLSILRQAAQSGSLYAYYGISEAYLEGGQRDSINSYAYLRLAYILGDSRAAGELAGRNLSSVERAVADERASSLYKSFAEERAPNIRPTD